MIKSEEIFRFLHRYENPVYIIDISSEKILYRNAIATEIYDIAENVLAMSQILKNKEVIDPKEAKKLLQTQGSAVYYDIYTITKEGESQLVDLELQYFDESKTKLYMEIRQKVDKRMEMALYQINQSHRPEVLLNFDENLSIIHCNEPFHQVFESSEELRHSHFKNDLVNGFLPEVREKLMCSIMQGLSVSSVFSTKLKVYTAKGEERWYLFELEKRTLDGSGEDKIFGYMTNIEEQVETEAQFALTNQYLSVLQKSTVDTLYRVDIINDVMYHYSDFTEGTGVEKAIPDYVNVFMREKTVHPDDQELYLSEFKNFYEHDIDPVHHVRFSLNGNPYQWYSITAKKIFDKDGNLKEVFGALVNVEHEHQIQEKINEFDRYFSVMQQLSDDILYRIDIKTQTLYHSYETSGTLRVGTVVPNYIDTFVNEKLVHPDDTQKYLENSKAWLTDDSIQCEVRMNVASDDYQWYSIKRKKIFDDEGNLVEIFGALVNIHKERVLKEKFDESNQYFSVMQQLSDDIYYRVEVDTMTLHHNFESEKPFTKQKAIPDYVNNFIREKIVHPDDVEQYLINLEAFNANELVDIPTRFALFDDEYHWYRARGRKIHDKNGNVTEIWGRLISEQAEKQAQHELSAVNQQFTAMQKLSDDILFHVEIATKTFKHSDQNAIDFGVPAEIPNYVDVFIEQEFIRPEDAKLYREYTDKLFSGEMMAYQIQAAVDVGVYDWFDVKCEFIYDNEGKAVEIFGRMRNIQKNKILEERAYHDLMTGALNKVSFEEEAGAIISEAIPEEKHAVIFIDLDDFKGVNDTLGHSYGDALLSTVGKRLKRLVRGDDLVGRIGGDEFAVLLRNVDSDDSVLVRTNLMLESLRRDFSFEKKIVGIKASIGVSLCPKHGTSYKELIEKADKAVYESKRRGKTWSVCIPRN